MVEFLRRWRWDWLDWLDWEKESVAELQDLVLLPAFALFFFTIRFILDVFVFERVGERLVYGRGGSVLKELSEADTCLKRRTLVKFKESAWKCVYYLSAEILALAVTYNEPWFTDTEKFWLGPGSQHWPDQLAKFKLKFLYCFAGGFYCYSIFALIFWETRRKDFGVSMGHHLATLILIVFSYLSRFHRVGSVVLALHDASDVFLELGKMSKYSGSEFVASFSFICFAISWVILRLVYFPGWVIWSTSYEVLQLLDTNYRNGPILYYIFNTLLISLFILHIYWWILIYRVIERQFQIRGKVEDVRSDSDSDDEKED